MVMQKSDDIPGAALSAVPSFIGRSLAASL
jgi:hypothetical protein